MEQPRWRQITAALLTSVVLGLACTCAITSANWIGATFPGFFLIANRVIASVSLPHWSSAQQHWIYQHAVIAINNQPVATAEALYDAVRQFPPGTNITYTLAGEDGQTSDITLSSQVFTREDYALLFVPYLLSGLALALTGIIVWFVSPHTPASFALLNGGLAGGLFAITGADLYAPSWFFRLHVLGEATFPAGMLIHLALVFPIDRFRRFRTAFLMLSYAVAFILGAAYEVFLYEPRVYSAIHNLCMVHVGLGGLILFCAVTWDYWTTDSHLIRQRVRVILLGFLGGYTVPGGSMLASGLTGGQIAVNYGGFTVFLFPLSLGYAIVKHDLFEIDAFLKRALFYLAFTATLAVSYITLLAVLNWGLRSTAFTRSAIFPLLFALAVAFFLNPVKDSLQRGIDHVFFRLRYDPKKVLEETSAVLASTLHLDEILSHLWSIIRETLGLRQGQLLLLGSTQEHYVTVHPISGRNLTLPVVHPLLQEVRQRRAFSIYDLESSQLSPKTQDVVRQGLIDLGAQLVIPFTVKGEVIGLITLGAKESGAFFTIDDIDFLYTLANQGALSISNARAYQAIQEFNTALEQKVEERTRELARTNEELYASVQQLEQAYRDLQRSQENLLRAEKMAALGRMTAGIAHEMNTPLGASLTSLKLLQDLVNEYQASIEDSSVNSDDHQGIAAEMDRLVRATQQWVEKAAAHIRSLRTHTRDLQRGEARPFSVIQVIDDTGLLLSHRLRLSQCSLIVSCTVTSPVLYGDPGKLGQVLTNLILNAIDAYQETKEARGEIFVQVSEVEDMLEIRVRDHGSGIPPERIEQIFEEFFSTKPLGEGTGLGLPIARNIITNFFGGTLSTTSTLGQGSEFLLRLPRENPVETGPKTKAPFTQEEVYSGEQIST
ncbi:MAG: GAF domain-containing protein [Deltaproteobacteria bacterium]|nr:GAF domain-containing protein [Deltaproteobacteria bacterium]